MNHAELIMNIQNRYTHIYELYRLTLLSLTLQNGCIPAPIPFGMLHFGVTPCFVGLPVESLNTELYRFVRC